MTTHDEVEQIVTVSSAECGDWLEALLPRRCSAVVNCDFRHSEEPDSGWAHGMAVLLSCTEATGVQP